MEKSLAGQGRCTGWCLGARGCMYTCQGGPHQRAVLSDSSSESLLSVTECRRACSRGLRRSVDPSSMWMEGTSKCTRSAERGRDDGANCKQTAWEAGRPGSAQASSLEVGHCRIRLWLDLICFCLGSLPREQGSVPDKQGAPRQASVTSGDPLQRQSLRNCCVSAAQHLP